MQLFLMLTNILLYVAMVWMFETPFPKFLCSNLITNVAVLEGGIFGKGLGHQGWALMSRINAHIKGPRELPWLFHNTENSKKVSSVKEKTNPHQTANLMASWSCSPQPPKLCTTNSYLLIIHFMVFCYSSLNRLR